MKPFPFGLKMPDRAPTSEDKDIRTNADHGSHNQDIRRSRPRSPASHVRPLDRLASANIRHPCRVAISEHFDGSERGTIRTQSGATGGLWHGLTANYRFLSRGFAYTSACPSPPCHALAFRGRGFLEVQLQANRAT